MKPFFESESRSAISFAISIIKIKSGRRAEVKVADRPLGFGNAAEYPYISAAINIIRLVSSEKPLKKAVPERKSSF